MTRKKVRNYRIMACSSLLFVIMIFICLALGTEYIDKKLLESNIKIAVDVAELVKNNFSITDAEVNYMKSLSFNEMEVDAINLRLMDIGDGALLNTRVTNVYLVAPLAKEEVKYIVDETTAESFLCEVGTPLDAIWLLNGTIDANGHFKPTRRDDIYRYTDMTLELSKGFEEKVSFGAYSYDEWGNFITGYVPIYTVEGNYVGMLGIDMDPNQYQNSVHSMVTTLVIIASLSIILATLSTFFFYLKYTKAMESRLHFDFYSKMSHDMRTPMNGILGMVHLAQAEDNLGELHDYFRKVGESSEYLLHLINDTLDVGKMTSGKIFLNKEPAVLAGVLENITDIVGISASTNEIHFEKKYLGIEPDLMVNMDVIRFKQILINLLSNAIKFTPAGGTVLFTAESSLKKEDFLHCIFIIKDTGIGMHKDFVKRNLYQPFSQENNHISTIYAGSGLGLAITKNLVEAMNGTITVESEPDYGTTFTVDLTFPIAGHVTPNNSEMYSMGQITSWECLAGKHILLCEDHPLNAQIAEKLLRKVGCIVDIAENGFVGVQMFSEAPENYYDVILMDIRMPAMNGLDATLKIRALDRADAKHIPIIAMTANAYAEDIENSMQAGMNAHLSKPIEPNIMYSTIAKFLKE